MISIMFQWQQIFDGAHVHEFGSGQALFQRGDPVRTVFRVLSGSVALERPLADGTVLTLHITRATGLVAEASLFASAYHCDGVAREPSRLARLTRDDFLTALHQSPTAVLELLELSAREVQENRARVEIMRMRRVSDRLTAWLDLYGEPAPGKWSRVADEIGVTPAALYRELALRRSCPAYAV